MKKRHSRSGQSCFIGRELPPSRQGRTGFTLIECIVSLAILAISLTSLLSSNASSVDIIGRSRDLTIATLLAQGKLVDIEQYLYDEKFKQGTETLKGNFKDEGWPDYKWAAEVREIETDLLNFSQGLDGLIPNSDKMEEDDKELMEDSMEGMVAMLGPMLDPFLNEISSSMRLIYLTITWPRGRYSQSASFSRLITNRDYSISLGDESNDTTSSSTSTSSNSSTSTSSSKTKSTTK